MFFYNGTVMQFKNYNTSTVTTMLLFNLKYSNLMFVGDPV